MSGARRRRRHLHRAWPDHRLREGRLRRYPLVDGMRHARARKAPALRARFHGRERLLWLAGPNGPDRSADRRPPLARNRRRSRLPGILHGRGRRAAPRTARHPPGIAPPFPASRQPRVRRPAPRGRVPPGARRALPCAISSSASGTLMGRLAKAVKVGVRAASAVSMWSSFISTGSARKFTTASVAPPL